jgi:hypothetical protein
MLWATCGADVFEDEEKAEELSLGSCMHASLSYLSGFPFDHFWLAIGI